MTTTRTTRKLTELLDAEPRGQRWSARLGWSCQADPCRRPPLRAFAAPRLSPLLLVRLVQQVPSRCDPRDLCGGTSPDGAKEGSRGRRESASKPPEPAPPICRRRNATFLRAFVRPTAEWLDAPAAPATCFRVSPEGLPNENARTIRFRASSNRPPCSKSRDTQPVARAYIFYRRPPGASLEDSLRPRLGPYRPFGAKRGSPLVARYFRTLWVLVRAWGTVSSSSLLSMRTGGPRE